MKNNVIGLGNSDAHLIFYTKNRPPLSIYQDLSCVKPMVNNEITHICHETGNHWRKIFNVYAKLLFELAPKGFSSWQQLRDNSLLQATSGHCLLFSPPNLSTDKSDRKLHIILGKSYAEQLGTQIGAVSLLKLLLLVLVSMCLSTYLPVRTMDDENS